MALAYTPRTELEAVNTMLEIIGEQPTSSLDISGISEVSIARDLLYSTNRLVQSLGWQFNSEDEYPLPPDVDGYVYIPPNTLQIDPSDDEDDYVVRGDRLYDRANHTYVISKTVNVDIVFFLDFEEIPQTAREYITVKAARQFQVRFLGASEIHQMTQQDEEQAWLALIGAEADDEDCSIFDSYSVARVLRRDRYGPS